MSFLSLARGDSTARSLLQRAIKARYGPRPVLVKTIRVVMAAEEKGLWGLPIKVSALVESVGLTHWRWRVTRKLFGLPISTSSESLDATVAYYARGRSVTVASDPQAVKGLQAVLWAAQAQWITPLTQEGVLLKSLDERTFEATHDQHPDITVTIHLNADDTIDTIKTGRYHWAEKRVQPFTIHLEEGLQTLNNFVAPIRVGYQWEGEPPHRFAVVGIEPNIVIPLTTFRLKK